MAVRYSGNSLTLGDTMVRKYSCGERRACSSSKEMVRTLYKMLTHVGVSDTWSVPRTYPYNSGYTSRTKPALFVSRITPVPEYELQDSRDCYSPQFPARK